MAGKVDTASVDASPLCFVVGPIGKDSSPERKHSDLLLKPLKLLARSERFELPTLGFEVRRSIELSCDRGCTNAHRAGAGTVCRCYHHHRRRFQ
jgi:hypothetical protein